MQPERLREITEQTQEAHRAVAAGEHAPRDRAFRAVSITSVLAILAAAGAVAFGGELLVEALRPKSASSFQLMKQIFGEHGQAAAMALAVELIIAGLALGIGAGVALAASIMEQLWVGAALKWSIVPCGAVLIGIAVGLLVLFNAGYTAGRLPWSLVAWLAVTSLPTAAYLAVCLLYLPAFRRAE